MTEIAKIYEQIAKLRETKSLEEIKLHLIASNYDKDSVEHAIKYIHQKEMNEEFMVKDALEYGMFFENFKIISCYALAIITAIGAIYFGINGIKIITASDNFTIYTNDYPYHHPVNDNIEKTELLVFPLIFAFIFIISTITLFHMAIKCVDHKKDLIKKLENMKKRNAIDAKHKSK